MARFAHLMAAVSTICSCLVQFTRSFEEKSIHEHLLGIRRRIGGKDPVLFVEYSAFRIGIPAGKNRIAGCLFRWFAERCPAGNN